ncbi:MAG: glycosyltransferase [Fimbriimonadaceae bacterium]|nr:glycosyltransferase [Fimbriimonadaceae bacterium]
MQPKISIVVPSYNHAPYIPQCVESVLAQTMPDWEMIVVDDGSTDDSMEVWKSFDDARIKLFQNDSNLGTYGNQNRGVSLASTDLIAILNSDDFWEPNKLALQLEALDRNPGAPLCYTHGWLAPNTNPLERKRDQHEDWPITEEQELFPWLLESNRVLASSVVFRKPFAKFDPGLRYSGDWMALLAASNHHTVAFVPEKLTYWRIHPTNSFSLAESASVEEIRIRQGLLMGADRWIDGRWDRAVVRRGLGACALHLAALYVLWGQMGLARKAARLGMRFHPNRRAAFRRWGVCNLPQQLALRQLWPGVDAPYRSGADETFLPISLNGAT